MTKPKKFAFGIDWRQWVIGIEFHRTNYGLMTEISFLPFGLIIASEEARRNIVRKENAQ